MGVPQGQLTYELGQRSTPDRSARRWQRTITLAAAVGIPYFFAAKLGLGLPAPSGFVTVFWPAMGFGVGVLIGLGPSARWPGLFGIIVANFLANFSSGAPPQIAAVTCLSGATECLLPALLVERWFGADLNLARLRHVLGLLAAAAVGSAAGAVCWIVASRLFYGPMGPIPTTFQHWFLSDMVGFIAVGPFVIRLFTAVRQSLPRREIIEGVMALLALAVLTGIVILLPSSLWETALPISWLFPILMWLVARCRPIFAAAAAFLVSITVVSTAVFDIGHFGDPKLPIDDRVLQAQVIILFVALSAVVLAALFAERKDSEARLALSNALLERERDNKLMNVQAVTASIVHEIRQPLAAISLNADVASQLLRSTPPSYDEALDALNEIAGSVQHTKEVCEGLRTLFGRGDQERRPVDVNELIRSVLGSLDTELKNHGVDAQLELTARLPLVDGNGGQLQEVVFNLAHNAIEAMDSTPDRNRILRVRTELQNDQAIAVSVQDTGPGIDPKQIDSIFGPFVTTKAQGTGLGLAICRMIVESHGGRLTATSDGGSGALFQFVLPINPTTQQGTPRPRS
jgi:signal transduction histidine kinase